MASFVFSVIQASTLKAFSVSGAKMISNEASTLAILASFLSLSFRVCLNSGQHPAMASWQIVY